MTPRTSTALLKQMMALHPTEIELSLGRMERLLAALDNPEARLPRVIHIAGTNGKGSTQAMIRAGLRASGARVSAYTSPHLVSFHERISLPDGDISEEALCDVLRRVLDANAGEEITYFEATTAAAFLAMAEAPADWALLEVGLGGRLDATNVLVPDLCVITPVDLDHQDFLGDDLGGIAGEKAGILKRRVPAVISRQADVALEVIEDRARRLGTPLLAQGQHWHVGTEHGRLVFQDETGLLDLPLPVLPGPHQIENAGTALAALRHLGMEEAACTAAVTQASWPARMQRLTAGPLPALAPEAELWLDGGHNPAAAEALAATLAALPRRETHLICGLMANKDRGGYLAPLAAHAASLTAVPVPDMPRAATPEALLETAQGAGWTASLAPDVQTALTRIAAQTPTARIVICGSLYLAGAVLALEG